MRKLMLTVLVALTSMVVGPVDAATARGNSSAAKMCQTEFAALGFANRGACTSFFARGGGEEPPPPAGEPALNVVGTVYNSCIAAGTTCWIGIYGTGLLPGSSVTLTDAEYCCDMLFPVSSTGNVVIEGVFICGGTGTRTFTFGVSGVAHDGSTITATPLYLASIPC